MARVAPKGIFPGEFVGSVVNTAKNRNQFYKASGEFRSPRAGEYFLSGADEQRKPTAYRAPNDLGIAYWIAVPVELVTCPHCQGTGKIVKG